VNGVNLTLRAGEIHGLLGPNGAGKTTLLRILLGLVDPDAGHLRILGRDARRRGAALPSGVAGFVDAPRFYPYLSGRKNLLLLARLDETSPPPDARRIEETLERVGLGEHADAKVLGYSSGMRQRLGLAGALLRSPRLLLLDEPTSSLDPAAARDLRATVRGLAEGGVAVLLSSHDMSEVEDLCGSLTILRRGEVVYAGSIGELRELAPRAVHRLHTSDDERARRVAADHRDVDLVPAERAEGLDVRAEQNALDGYVLALGREGIAVRGLESQSRSLEELFLRLTANNEGSAVLEPPTSALPGTETGTGTGASTGRDPHFALRGVLAASRVEIAKVRAQTKTWALLGVCLLGPFAFAAAVKLEGSTPDDTLFGRWAATSGLSVPLVVLGFAALWAVPILASVIGGDIFSSEDRYGTWPALWTRSRSRGEIFAGKTLTALAVSLLSVFTLGASSTLAGILLIGREPLLGLSGTLISPDRALPLTTLAWVSIVPPVFAFTALAIFCSAATRSSAAGIGLPLILGFAMQLCTYLPASAFQKALLTPTLVAWHGLFVEPRYYRPLALGTVTSGVYFLTCLGVAFALYRGRE
jgi:ABC-2 type transport system ATP-binding protein